MTTAQQTIDGPCSPPPCSAAHIDPFLNEDYAKALTPAPEPPRCRFLLPISASATCWRRSPSRFLPLPCRSPGRNLRPSPRARIRLGPRARSSRRGPHHRHRSEPRPRPGFRLLAKNHITRKDAVAFGYIAQLLLQTVPGVRAEAVSAFGHKAWASHLQSTLTPQPNPPAAESTAPICAPAVPAVSPSATRPADPAPQATPPTSSSQAPNGGP